MGRDGREKKGKKKKKKRKLPLITNKPPRQPIRAAIKGGEVEKGGMSVQPASVIPQKEGGAFLNNLNQRKPQEKGEKKKKKKRRRVEFFGSAAWVFPSCPHGKDERKKKKRLKTFRGNEGPWIARRGP